MKTWLGNLRMTNKLPVSPLAAMCFFAIFAFVSRGGFFKQRTVLDDIVQDRFGNSGNIMNAPAALDKAAFEAA